MNRPMTDQEKIDKYPGLYSDCFGYPPDESTPEIVIVHEEDGVMKGFMSGFLKTEDTFFYSFGGTVEGHSFVGSRKHFGQVYELLYRAGVRHVECAVENTNATWQRLLLSMGWFPYGLRVVKNKILIDYYKEL